MGSDLYMAAAEWDRHGFAILAKAVRQVLDEDSHAMHPHDRLPEWAADALKDALHDSAFRP